MRVMNDSLCTPVDPEGIRRFLFEGAGVRGVIVRLEHSWRQILGRDDYPDNIAQVLGEVTAATALFAGDIQLAGHVSVQLKASPLLPLVFAECTAEGRMRGLARWGEDAASRSLRPDELSGAVLAITIERQESGTRYQGLVPLEGDLWLYDLAAGKPRGEAIVESTVRRFRPIVLTAAAAVLAMVPLTRSDFFGPMAVAIMGGLLVATALTLLFLPALYAAWNKLGQTG